MPLLSDRALHLCGGLLFGGHRRRLGLQRLRVHGEQERGEEQDQEEGEENKRQGDLSLQRLGRLVGAAVGRRHFELFGLVVVVWSWKTESFCKSARVGEVAREREKGRVKFLNGGQKRQRGHDHMK